MNLTIRDIARMAGVSRSTVSLALNDSPRISKATKEKVMAIVQKVGYHPNVMARGLVEKQSRVIFVIIPEVFHVFSDYYFSETVSGILDVVTQNGYYLMIEVATSKFKVEKTYYKLFREKRMDGVLFVGNLTNDSYIVDLQNMGCPICLVNSSIPGVSTVIADNVKGAFQATEHLIKLGHRRIGFIKGLDFVTTATDRQIGFKMAMDKYSLPIDRNHIAFGNFHEESGFEAVNKIFNHSEPPTAIFSTNDMMAVGAINALKQKGIKVPEEVAVVGGDDIKLVSYFTPKLTTIRQPMFKIGQLATEALLKIISGESMDVLEQIVPTKFIIRESCGYTYKGKYSVEQPISF